MKKIILIQFLLSLAILNQAAILRCNNAGFSGTYVSLQAAHDAASAGDTIHMEPGGVYGSLYMSKKLVIIGTGDFIPQNPGYQANQNPGWSSGITVNPGSEFSTISCKVVGNLTISCNNIFVTNSSVQNIYIGFGNSNISVSKSIISAGCYESYYNTSISFLNCYINKLNGNYGLSSEIYCNYNLIGIDNTTQHYANGVFSNNIFFDITTSSNAAANNTNFISCNLMNNITSNYSMIGNNYNGTNVMVDGNSGFGNSHNVDMNTVFQNWGNFTGDNYQLKASYSNQNIGMYAGGDPYKPACTPAIPSIYQMSIPVQGAGNSFNFTISTRSNN